MKTIVTDQRSKKNIAHHDCKLLDVKSCIIFPIMRKRVGCSSIILYNFNRHSSTLHPQPLAALQLQGRVEKIPPEPLCENLALKQKIAENPVAISVFMILALPAESPCSWVFPFYLKSVRVCTSSSRRGSWPNQCHVKWAGQVRMCSGGPQELCIRKRWRYIHLILS